MTNKQISAILNAKVTTVTILTGTNKVWVEVLGKWYMESKNPNEIYTDVQTVRLHKTPKLYE